MSIIDQDLLMELLETKLETNVGREYLYKPPTCLAKPIIFKDWFSCTRHWSKEKCKLKIKELQSLATEIRIKWNVGEYKTLVR